MTNLNRFWKPDDANRAITVERTDKTFLRGVHRGEPMWKVSRGESYMIILQKEAMVWSQMLQEQPKLTEDKVTA